MTVVSQHTFSKEAQRANAALMSVFPTPVFAPHTMKAGTDRLTCSDRGPDRSELKLLSCILESSTLSRDGLENSLEYLDWISEKERQPRPLSKGVMLRVALAR